MAKILLAAFMLLALLVPVSVCGQTVFFEDNRSPFSFSVGYFSGGKPDRQGAQFGFGKSYAGRVDVGYGVGACRQLLLCHFGAEVFLIRQKKDRFPVYFSIGQSITQEKATAEDWVTVGTSSAALYRRCRLSDSFSIIPVIGVARVDAIDVRAKTVGTALAGLALVRYKDKGATSLSISFSYGDGIATCSGLLAISLTTKKPVFQREEW